jgi:hypothetical protein
MMTLRLEKHDIQLEEERERERERKVARNLKSTFATRKYSDEDFRDNGFNSPDYYDYHFNDYSF